MKMKTAPLKSNIVMKIVMKKKIKVLRKIMKIKTINKKVNDLIPNSFKKFI